MYAPYGRIFVSPCSPLEYKGYTLASKKCSRVILKEYLVKFCIDAYLSLSCPSSSTSLHDVISILLYDHHHCYSQAIPATAHGLFASNTFCRIRATRVSCTTHRTAAVTSELPTPRPKVLEQTASKRMKENARPTLLQVRSFVDAPGPPSIVENSEEMLMEVRG